MDAQKQLALDYKAMRRDNAKRKNMVKELNEQIKRDHGIKAEQLLYISKLEARIKLALRLDATGLVGFIMDALNGVDLSNVLMSKNLNLFEYIDAVEKEEVSDE